MIEFVHILAMLFVVRIIQVELKLRRMRKDMLNITKGARQARIDMLERREYKTLEK